MRFKLISFFLRLYKRNSGIFYCDERLNIGDSAVPIICKEFKVASSFNVDLKYANQRQTRGSVLFTIGSVLQWADSHSKVWGSGFISKESKCNSLPKIYALRGALSKRKIEEQFSISLKGIPLCDPGLLASRLIHIDLTFPKKYQLGIVPHYADKHLLNDIKFNSDTLVLDVETSNLQSFCSQINQCERIVSSSLHGLVFSDAFSIPNAWIFLSNDVYGDGFKFNDYFSSFPRDPRIQNTIKPKDLISFSSNIEFFSKPRNIIKQMQDNLLLSLK